MVQVIRKVKSIVLLLTTLITISSSLQSPKVAIIGAGAGGSSAAYYLSQLLNNNVEIDVFESSDTVGGRLATSLINGNGYEAGGSIIHPRNKLAVDLAKKFNLAQLKDSGSSSIMSIYKDNEFVFSTSRWKLMSIVKTLYRYGFDFNRLQSLTAEFIHEFDNIYKLQDSGKSFEDLESMLRGISPKIYNLTQSNLKTYLLDLGFKKIFVDEIVQGITYVNYGQNAANLHSLVGLVSVAGASDGLWSVIGGNKMLPMALFNNSNAKMYFNSRIRSVISRPGNTFKVSKEANGANAYPTFYDYVIIATPFNAREPIEFLKFENKSIELGRIKRYAVNREYHKTIATIVSAHRIMPKFKPYIDVISSTPTDFFTSISRIYPNVLVRSETAPVYKVFSQDIFSPKELNQIFKYIVGFNHYEWAAYPDYDSIPPKMPQFLILPNVYHLNAIEEAASAIEMSLISGRNAALNIASNVHKKEGGDGERSKSSSSAKDEL